MRTKLTPDNSKLVIATAGGYLMVIHDVDLDCLSSDLHEFKPNMYRLMQMSQTPMRQGYKFNHLFSRGRNRVELISDFPSENEAEMIASLEVSILTCYSQLRQTVPTPIEHNLISMLTKCCK